LRSAVPASRLSPQRKAATERDRRGDGGTEETAGQESPDRNVQQNRPVRNAEFGCRAVFSVRLRIDFCMMVLIFGILCECSYKAAYPTGSGKDFCVIFDAK